MEESQAIENTGESRINRLLKQCPEGAPMTSVWLENNGVTPQLAARYKKSGWLSPLGRGAWIRSGKKLDWRAGIYALQSQQNLQVYPAGKTALELLGRGHYVPMGKTPPIQLSIPDKERLPDWFKKQPFAANLMVLNSSVLFDPVYTALTTWDGADYAIKISTPERAMLELCHLLPQKADTEEVKLLMQGLTSLRPQLVQKTLLECQSVKAKRLFLVLAEMSGHAWFQKLDIEQLELGKGKRVLPVEGKLDPRFQITVPQTWMEE
ncbi:MAG: type IV toxin-antitoxin system AbiEi family antitoxin domain-containing protein [Gammaproteobacteria bacterium]